MNLTRSELRELADIAVAAACAAGGMIARSRPVNVEHKEGGDSLASQVVTEIDRRSEAIILDHLVPTLAPFDLALLTEERDDDGGRLTADHFWCVDPLDGTLPFIEGVPGYAVSIALVARDGTPLIGVIHDPVEGSTVHAIRSVGAFRDGTAWAGSAQPLSDRLSVFADRSFSSSSDHALVVDALDRLADDLGLAGVEIRTGAGAVMNAWGVLTTPPACYFKDPKPAGGGSLWDFAATACLFNEVGATATDMAGERLDLNRVDSTFMHHRGVLFATDHRLAEHLRTRRRT